MDEETTLEILKKLGDLVNIVTVLERRIWVLEQKEADLVRGVAAETRGGFTPIVYQSDEREGYG